MSANTKIAASILTADFGNLKQNLLKAQKEQIDIIHFDVMDGHFVPNISFGAALINSLKKFLTIPFDVHLMIQEPYKYLDDFIKSGANWISFHWEVVTETGAKRICKELRQKNIKAGIALSPLTDPKVILPILDDIDFVLIMTVEPGFGGQNIIPECLKKIKFLKQIFNQKNLPIQIEVDGGINKENILAITNLGADILVAGSAIFHTNYSIQEGINNLKTAIS